MQSNILVKFKQKLETTFSRIKSHQRDYDPYLDEDMFDEGMFDEEDGSLEDDEEIIE